MTDNTKAQGINTKTAKLPRVKNRTVTNDKDDFIKNLQKQLEDKEKLIKILQADNNSLKVELHKLEQNNTSLEYSKKALHINSKRQSILTLTRKKLSTTIHKDNKLEELDKSIELIFNTQNYEDFFLSLIKFL